MQEVFGQGLRLISNLVNLISALLAFSVRKVVGRRPWGYSEFLEAISNPEHEQHEELLEWIGGEFDPEMFDVAEVNEEIRARILRSP